MLISQKLNPSQILKLHKRKIFLYEKDSYARSNITLDHHQDARLESYVSLYGQGDRKNVPLRVGSFTYSWSDLDSNMTVGRYCSIAHGLKLMGGRHALERMTTSPFSTSTNQRIFHEYIHGNNVNFDVDNNFDKGLGKITIGHDCWIGNHVLLARGLSIGTGSIIAAGSVVTKDVEPYSIVGGNPAKIIRMRFRSDSVEALLKSDWYSYGFDTFSRLPIGWNVESDGFFDRLMALLEESKKFTPPLIKLKNLFE